MFAILKHNFLCPLVYLKGPYKIQARCIRKTATLDNTRYTFNANFTQICFIIKKTHNRHVAYQPLPHTIIDTLQNACAIG